MWSLRASAALAVCLMCVLLCSPVESGGGGGGGGGSPQSGCPTTTTRDNSVRGPKKTGEPRRSEVSTNNRVGRATVRCMSECNLYYGHIIDDETSEKIYISKAGNQPMCSCELAPAFKKKLKNRNAEPLPRGTKCTGQMKKHKCSCGVSDKMRRYMDRNHFDSAHQVCLLSSVCKCTITRPLVNYLRRKGVDMDAFKNLVNSNGASAIPPFLAEIGIQVLSERVDDEEHWQRREVRQR